MGVRQLGCRKGLAIASLNVNSLLLHIDEIKNLIKEKSLHVLALNETKLDGKIASDLLQIDGYTLYRSSITNKVTLLSSISDRMSEVTFNNAVSALQFFV